MSVNIKDIEAFKESLKIGAKVNYRTPVTEFDENPRYHKKSNKAVVIKKLKNVAIVEYTAKRGRNTARVMATMPYKEIYMLQIGKFY